MFVYIMHYISLRCTHNLLLCLEDFLKTTYGARWTLWGWGTLDLLYVCFNSDTYGDSEFEV